MNMDPTKLVRWFAAVASLVSGACTAGSAQSLEGEEGGAVTAAIAVGECVLHTDTTQQTSVIQNKNGCGETVEVLRDSINQAYGRVVTRRVCEELTYDEKLDICGNDFREQGDEGCWLARVSSIRTLLYLGSGCGSPPLAGDTGGNPPPEPSEEEEYEPSDHYGDPGYQRTDGCGFDQYGRWVCNGGQY